LVAASFKRFYAAALAKETVDGDKPKVDAAAPKLPPDLQLNEEAKPINSYHVLWPDDVAGKISGEKPSPLEVYYVRAEEQNRPKKAVSYYAHQLMTRVSDARSIDNKAIWIDGMKVDAQNDRRRSVDVWITRAVEKAGEAVGDDEVTDLIVEILVIEIKDPVTRDVKEPISRSKDE
jgi:hypothetical protein